MKKNRASGHGEVLCIGHASWDIFLYLPEFPEEDNKQLIHDSGESPGGPSANAAGLLGMWGVPASFAGVVGDDPYGRAIAEEFKAGGVNTDFLQVKKNQKTALSVVLVNRRNGSRTIITRRRSPAVYSVNWQDFRPCPPAFILTDGHEPEAAVAALETFPEAVSVLDAGGYRKSTVELASRVEYLVSSERFAAGLIGTGVLKTNRDVSRGLAALAEVCPGKVAVTLGERGCAYISNEGRVHSIPAVETMVVDTTAAGDIFHGAFVYALRENRDFAEALNFASGAAALSVARPGGRNSVPGLEEVIRIR